MKSSIPRLLAALLCAGLTGCASYSGIEPIARLLDIRQLLNKTEEPAFAGWPRQDWWHSLGDPDLDRLIETTLQGNPSLQAADARLEQARAISGLTESSLWPGLSASLSSTRERFSEHGLVPPPYAGSVRNINDLQLAGHWEIDFFGKNREALRAAVGELRASEAEHQASRQLLASNVARSYYNLARLLAQRDLAEQRQTQRRDLAELVERRFKAGLDTRVELELAQGALPENARDIASLDEQIALARHALAALTGQVPEAADKLAPRLPDSPPLTVPVALPIDLLGHRADIAAARWRVESANHGLASARAMFYPNVDLRGFTGLSAIGYTNWLKSASSQPGIGLAVSLPIFDADRLRSQYRGAAAYVDNSVAAYNGALLDALRDVADQLSSLQALETQQQRQAAAQESTQKAYDLALQRYRAEISDRLNVLNVETQLLAQKRISIDLQARRIDTGIRLIHALGGGFQAEPDAAATDRPATPVAATHAPGQSS